MKTDYFLLGACADDLISREDLVENPWLGNICTERIRVYQELPTSFGS